MIPSSTTISDEGRRTRRTLLCLFGGIVALNLIVWAATSLSSGGSVSGPDGSTFVTTRDGSAAVAGMLERLGIEVVRSRLPLDEAALSSETTLVLIDVAAADYTTSELRALEEFLDAGGSVVVAGATEVVGRLLPDASVWRSQGGSIAHPRGPLLEEDSFQSVLLSGFGSFEVSNSDTPIWVTDGEEAVAVARSVGDGFFAWVADSYPFHNDGIGQEESAVAIYRLLDPSGTVVFDEVRHGFRQNGGLWLVIPANWRRMLGLAGVVALLGLIAYARRLGPPHDFRRRLPPSREAYLEAVAGIMSRAGASADATEVIRTEARARLRARTSEGADLAEVAAAAGLDGRETEAILGESRDDETLMAADGGLAILNQEQR
jgi:hypothetical protein